MGRIFRKEITGIACDVKSCRNTFDVFPGLSEQAWDIDLPELHKAISQGWALILHSRLRSYCPVHASRVWSCTCKTHPAHQHLCTACTSEAADSVWTSTHTPKEIITYSHQSKGV